MFRRYKAWLLSRPGIRTLGDARFHQSNVGLFHLQNTIATVVATPHSKHLPLTYSTLPNFQVLLLSGGKHACSNVHVYARV